MVKIILGIMYLLYHLSTALLAVWSKVVSVYGLLRVAIANAVASGTLTVVIPHVDPIGKMMVVP